MSPTQNLDSGFPPQYHELEGSIPQTVAPPQNQVVAELEATTAGRGIDIYSCFWIKSSWLTRQQQMTAVLTLTSARD